MTPEDDPCWILSFWGFLLAEHFCEQDRGAGWMPLSVVVNVVVLLVAVVAAAAAAVC